MSLRSAARAGLARTGAAARSVLAAVERTHPAVVVLVLVGVQLVVNVAIALTSTHNGWLYYSGGDGVAYWTTSSTLADFRIPYAFLGYGLSLLQAPIAGVAGANMLRGLPFLVVLNLVVVVPVATASIYGIALRVAGRWFGALAGTLWVLAPAAAIPFFRESFHEEFHSNFLPIATGFTPLGDLPSAAALAAAAYFTVRAFQNDAVEDAIVAGLVTGFAIGIKPSNALFVPAPLLALLVARRLRGTAVFVAALAPALLTLAIWKYRGRGLLPFGASETREAAGGGLSSVTERFHGDLWNNLLTNLDQLREVGWSRRFAEWVVVAGVIGALRLSRPYGVLLLFWIAGIVLLKGSTGVATVYDTSFFRLTLPGYPAVTLAAASIVFLVPRFPRPAVAPPGPVARRWVYAAVAALAVVPLAVVLASRRAPQESMFWNPATSLLIAATDQPATKARVRAGEVSLSWESPETAGSKVLYRVFRQADPPASCQPIDTGLPGCVLQMTPVAVVSEPRYVDRPGPGRYAYRIGVAAGWRARPINSDTLFLGPEVVVQTQ